MGGRAVLGKLARAYRTDHRRNSCRDLVPDWPKSKNTQAHRGPPPITFRIGIISDTHGLLRPAAERRLAGVDHIIHGDDIGSPEIIDAPAPE